MPNFYQYLITSRDASLEPNGTVDLYPDTCRESSVGRYDSTKFSRSTSYLSTTTSTAVHIITEGTF
jgi:hypothetical protein